MDSHDKYWLALWAMFFSALLGVAICMTVSSINTDKQHQAEFEAATKAGLIQRVDPHTSRTIWVKSTE